MLSFAKTLAMVKRQNPKLDNEEARELAHDWLRDAAEEAANREDTPCLEEPWWARP